jgi:hypothetical protein
MSGLTDDVAALQSSSRAARNISTTNIAVDKFGLAKRIVTMLGFWLRVRVVVGFLFHRVDQR